MANPNSHDFGPLVEDVVARGVDDWVSDAELLDIAAGAGAHEPLDRRAIAIGLLAEVLIGELMGAGTLTEEGFAAWSCSAAEAVTTVTSDWLSRSDPLVMPGEIVWLCNTPRGESLGEEVLARERDT